MRLFPLLLKTAMGAAAGYAAGKAMYPVTVWLYDRESPEARKREDEARNNQVVYDIAAAKIARILRLSMNEVRQQRLSQAVQLSIVLGAGVTYAFLRDRFQATRKWNGIAYGTGVELVADQFATVALGLTPGPRAFPWQTHLRGVLAHFVYGFVLESVMKGYDLFRTRLASPDAIQLPSPISKQQLFHETIAEPI